MTKPMIHCPNCRRVQPDPMKEGVTCEYCGMSPLSSRAYPRDCSFYPKPYVPVQKPTVATIVKRVALRRQQEHVKPRSKNMIPKSVGYKLCVTLPDGNFRIILEGNKADMVRAAKVAKRNNPTLKYQLVQSVSSHVGDIIEGGK